MPGSMQGSLRTLRRSLRTADAAREVVERLEAVAAPQVRAHAGHVQDRVLDTPGRLVRTGDPLGNRADRWMLEQEDVKLTLFLFLLELRPVLNPPELARSSRLWHALGSGV